MPPVNADQLREKAKRLIDALPEERLRSATDFMKYLADLEPDEESLELAAVPGLVDAVRRGEQELSRGEGVNWREVRRSV